MSSIASHTHRLMPGVRCAGLLETAWPRVLHDEQLSGFSPLVCGMTAAPGIWSTIVVGGELAWAASVATATGATAYLVSDGRLRRLDTDGKVRWTGPHGGRLHYFGDLCGDGRDCIMLGSGRRLVVLDADTGEVRWQHDFHPPHAQVRTAAGPIMEGRVGVGVAVFLAYDGHGGLLHFGPSGPPEFVWWRLVVDAGEWPERADHGCSVQLDRSQPDAPLLWNIRHHRCRGFDARTGETVSSLTYRIGGDRRRNYGPWSLATGPHGERFICVVAEQIQTHVHAVRLDRHGDSTLAWEHYYGDVYVRPGVVVRQLAVVDLDGDGADEVVYSVRDPEHGFRSFVRVRDVATGHIRAELEDQWGAAVWVDPDIGHHVLLSFPAPSGRMPDQGALHAHVLAAVGQLQLRSVIDDAQLWSPRAEHAVGRGPIILRQGVAAGAPVLREYRVSVAGLQIGRHTRAASLTEASAVASVTADGSMAGPAAEPGRTAASRRPGSQGAIPEEREDLLVSGADGALRGVTWRGETRWHLDLRGGSPPTLSAADLDGDGAAELVAVLPGHRVSVTRFSGDGSSQQQFTDEFYAPRQRLGPLLYDLLGDGQRCLIAPGRAPTGELLVRALRANGELLWETVLDAVTDDGGQVVSWNAGHFLPAGRSAVAASVLNAGRTLEGTYLLDGPTGSVRWFRDRHRDGAVVRGFIPAGLPLAYDVDGDGVEEIGMDLYSYMAWIRGQDGSFAMLNHTRNIRAEDAIHAGMLYNSFSPVFFSPDTRQPHWLASVGYGEIGLNDPDPRHGPWRDDLGYDVPTRAGLVDVDGDGTMEIGYAPLHSSTFLCRDLWTGEVKWELELPGTGSGPVITADVDGDGKGEFLFGRWCIGTDAEGQGQIRWEAPVPLGWAIIADLDGDGLGEIACASGGRIHVLKAR